MHNPEPIERNLDPLRDAVLSSNALVGVAMDGDADRVGAIDGSGEYITALQVFTLLAYYMLEVRGFRGPLVKSLTTSNMVLRLGERYDVPVHETSVGFKYIAPLMLETDALIGGEESGGFGFRGHIPERDGVLSALFLLDLVARKGMTLSAIIEEIYDLVGPHHYDRLDVVFDGANRAALESRLHDMSPKELAGEARCWASTPWTAYATAWKAASGRSCASRARSRSFASTPKHPRRKECTSC